MEIQINSDEFWVKIVDFLQQNWALIETQENKVDVIVYFIQDASMIFDKMEFDTLEQAEMGLRINGFEKYLGENENFKDFIVPPKRPFGEAIRPIYSTGQFWKE